MVRHANLFSQILNFVPRGEFHNLVRNIGTERHSKGFSSWDHFTSMMFCQVAQAKSLREIHQGLSCCLGKLNHIGMQKAPCKSTLAYANQHRSWMLFESLFYRLVNRCKCDGFARNKLPLPGKLFSLDATIIPLCLSIFDWAKYRSTKGAVKLHLVLDHDGYLPHFAVVTKGPVHELTPAKYFHFPRGSIVVVDRAYWSANLFRNWIRDQVFFVIRAKKGMKFTVVEERKVSGQVLEDQIVEFGWEKQRSTYPHLIRRVKYKDPETGKVYSYITNLLTLPAQTIADIYKERWQIELFFKAIKQNLKIKTFIGTSPNAVLTQIWTALIAMLILKYLKLRSSKGWALSNLVTLVRWNLFTYRDLWDFLDDPFKTPPEQPPQQQLAFDFYI